MASFDRRGERIVTGSSKGKVLVIDTVSLDVLKIFKLSGNAIKSIDFARRGRLIKTPLFIVATHELVTCLYSGTQPVGCYIEVVCLYSGTCI